MKIYDLPTFSSTLEFLTMLTLSTGRLLKVCLSSPKLKKPFLSRRWHPDILSAARHVLIDWNHQKIPFFSELPALPATHIHVGTLCVFQPT
jgi:nuclear GTP-binding protein